jgi:hypothetical protein
MNYLLSKYLVIKNIAYFPHQCALNSRPVMDAVLDSLMTVGVKPQENSWGSDAAVIWSVLWNGRMAPNQQVYEHYRSQGKPVIVVDVGTLYRNRTWKLAVNNINATGYYGHEENLDWDRPRDFGISVAMSFSKNPAVLIAAQHARSLQVQALGRIEPWVHQQIAELRKVTDRPIHVRSHPRSPLVLAGLSPDIVTETPQYVPDTYDSFDMNFDYHAIVNYNSGPGIQAAVAGVRPIVDSTSLAYPVSVAYKDIERAYDVDRDQWLVKICHTEYTVDELQRGTWIKRIAPALESTAVV